MKWLLLALLLFRVSGSPNPVSLQLLSPRIIPHAPLQVRATLHSGYFLRRFRFQLTCTHGHRQSFQIPYNTSTTIQLKPPLPAGSVCEMRSSQGALLQRFTVEPARVSLRVQESTLTAGEADLQYWLEAENGASLPLHVRLLCASDGLVNVTQPVRTSSAWRSFPVRPWYFGACSLEATVGVDDREYLMVPGRVDVIILSPVLPLNEEVGIFPLGTRIPFPFLTANNRNPTVTLHLHCPQSSRHFQLRSAISDLSLTVDSAFGDCTGQLDLIPFYNVTRAVVRIRINRPVALEVSQSAISAPQESLTVSLSAPLAGPEDFFSLQGDCTYGSFSRPVKLGSSTGIDFTGEVYGDCILTASTLAPFYQSPEAVRVSIFRSLEGVIEAVERDRTLRVLVRAMGTVPVTLTVTCTPIVFGLHGLDDLNKVDRDGLNEVDRDGVDESDESNGLDELGDVYSLDNTSIVKANYTIANTLANTTQSTTNVFISSFQTVTNTPIRIKPSGHGTCTLSLSTPTPFYRPHPLSTKPFIIRKPVSLTFATPCRYSQPLSGFYSEPRGAIRTTCSYAQRINYNRTLRVRGHRFGVRQMRGFGWCGVGSVFVGAEGEYYEGAEEMIRCASSIEVRIAGYLEMKG